MKVFNCEKSVLNVKLKSNCVRMSVCGKDPLYVRRYYFHIINLFYLYTHTLFHIYTMNKRSVNSYLINYITQEGILRSQLFKSYQIC